MTDDLTGLIATNAMPATSNWRAAIDPLTAAERSDIERLASQYPRVQAATIEALKVVQANHGWVSDGKLKAIADALGMSPHEVDSVATFYNRIYRKAVGKTVVALCNSVSCWMLGYPQLEEKICAHLDTPLGGTSTDGAITLLPTACLGACDRAPVAMLGDHLAGPLTPDKLQDLVAKARQARL